MENMQYLHCKTAEKHWDYRERDGEKDREREGESFGLNRIESKANLVAFWASSVLRLV